ncbi:protein RETICULATA-RELATED 3, chloroplastic [Rhodamnia argentea]|uniref:Protein RETICULATA-RELATED 3, chloroplastic n=1 Tax=Rhodamnia argentea TaxID=178133 RepID=A0A8B8PUW7_9MYRT|nr:protein RETICULATA-RELATED 3, chloroplastic [Rhodamnia argentea]XP_030538567.2 protein RETICULATA-RELATED 3, chloroplastic [Rhodamnia argentea]XP_030538568.2 protein RETICULATA-RELATED 3, chloroplastic [Rhodamnia argentea]
MAALSQLRYNPLGGRHYSFFANNRHRINNNPSAVAFSPSSSSLNSQNQSFLLPEIKPVPARLHAKFDFSCGGGGGNGGVGNGSSGSGGSGGWSGSGDGSSDESKGVGILGLFLNGWRSRVAADPQFPFKVLMEEIVGVSACVLGDMASRPNFGLNELDFVFSTLVVGCILNFTLMYLLAPTASVASSSLPAIFASCPKSHMFEAGAYGMVERFGTFVYKGMVFAAVGFAAGLVGTALSNGLIKMRKKMDPNFETPNKPPPTILNAATWAIHMGLSSNFRYQTLNGIEFLLEKWLPALAFKTSVVALRCANNVLGGMTFVILARLTGSQSVEEGKPGKVEDGLVSEKAKLVDGEGKDVQGNENSCK